MPLREYDDIVLRKRQDKSCIQGKDGSNADNVGSGKELYDKNVCEYDVEVDISALSSSITVNIGKNIYIPGEGGKYAESITFLLVDKKTLSTDKKNTPDNAKICVNKSNNGYAKYYDYDKINKFLNVRFRKPTGRYSGIEDRKRKEVEKRAC